ncbi:cytochrome b/b6 domain-containing protein [Colwellia sp. MB3u-70]|uniref:cytochrome b/b6 domain-containing protein n=1 Tax=unclassified Colwellia TaxID=196834 RepID=UPI0015F53CDB|nr:MULTISPECIES: cytochrome b/b6 domain-containing protein [unclassified Colwellia]MBA6293151.1 cytochrome b/b6 domain-containing protein [Colwellia sp. MB3u-8]MBA6307077.1 cytochrome b/b6 domain-containing protein [Colwellia sp. MB3u-70]
MNINRQQVFVWSRKVRLFHWINVIAILLLIAIGTVILNGKAFGLSTEGKVLLKTIHVLVGYVFASNLIFRLIIAFVGKGYERWHKILPFKKGFKAELVAFTQGKKVAYKGHSPAGKLMVLALLSVMTVQMISGLVIAGTDIYYPPFGQYFAESIAINKDNIAAIAPYSKENVDAAAYQVMRDFREPFITAHVYAFYCLLLFIPLHIIGVIIAERREKSALVSAMINGYKYLPNNKTDEH